MYSPHRHPILGPWSLQSAAPVPPPLPQLRLRLPKQLPAPITTQATHTTSTCPRASLRRHPTTPQRTRRPSRLCPLPCLSDDPFLGLPWSCIWDFGRPGRTLIFPSPDYKQLPGTSPDGRLGLLASASASQLPTLALGTAPSSFLLTISGALGSTGDSLFTAVAPSHRGTLWPLLHHSPAPSA